MRGARAGKGTDDAERGDPTWATRSERARGGARSERAAASRRAAVDRGVLRSRRSGAPRLSFKVASSWCARRRNAREIAREPGVMKRARSRKRKSDGARYPEEEANGGSSAEAHGGWHERRGTQGAHQAHNNSCGYKTPPVGVFTPPAVGPWFRRKKPRTSKFCLASPHPVQNATLRAFFLPASAMHLGCTSHHRASSVRSLWPGGAPPNGWLAGWHLRHTPSTRMEIRTWRSAIADLSRPPPGAPSGALQA